MKVVVWLGSLCWLVAAPAFAGSTTQVPAAEHFARRCQRHAPSRFIDPQGTMLWGTWSGWTEVARTNSDDRKSVLVSTRLDGLLQAPEGVTALRLEGGRLAAGDQSPVGSVLQGMSSDGKPTEVAICDAQPSPRDQGVILYGIEAWNPVSQGWENPCAPTGTIAQPRALAVGGVWDSSGAHHAVEGKITFACETGVISKCIAWGYKPWVSQGGRSLAEAHQACTRMARADYCGDGQSHTVENTFIEYYDTLGLSARATRASEIWDPARASFEAAWAPDGATCMARTRTGGPLAAILKECPGRFQEATVDLGEGDRCTATRADRSTRTGILRNRIEGAAAARGTGR